MNTHKEEVVCIVEADQYSALMDRLLAGDSREMMSACYKWCYCPDCGCNQALEAHSDD
jgi:hypothetical protein